MRYPIVMVSHHIARTLNKTVKKQELREDDMPSSQWSTDYELNSIYGSYLSQGPVRALPFFNLKFILLFSFNFIYIFVPYSFTLQFKISVFKGFLCCVNECVCFLYFFLVSVFPVCFFQFLHVNCGFNLFYFINILLRYVCFLMIYRKGININEREGGKELEGSQEWKTVITGHIMCEK